MKKVFIIMILAVNICSISCNNSNVKPAGKINQEAILHNSENKISFKVNDELVHTSGWNISRFDMGKNTQLNITSNMHEDKRTIMINIKDSKAGSYSLQTTGEAYGDYKPDYQDLADSYSFQDGTIIITSIDTLRNILNATFEGTVKNNQGKNFRITEGEIINGKITPGITRY